MITNYQLRKERLREARKKGKHTKEEWLKLVAECGCCVRCEKKETTLTKDHIIPIYQGGSDGIDNIQPLCRRCNSQKGPETINWVNLRKQAIDARWAKKSDRTTGTAKEVNHE